MKMPTEATQRLAILKGGNGQPGVFMGIQPIVDREGCVCAHKLISRSKLLSHAAVSDDTTVDSITISTLQGQSGMRLEKSDVPIFVDAGSELLFAEVLEKLPPGMVALRILESLLPTPGLVERCRYLHRFGYTLALDDFVFEASCEQLLDVVGIVRFDLCTQSLDDVLISSLAIRAKHSNIRCLAVNVESQAQYARLSACGFDYFEGFFFARPDAELAKKGNSSVLSVLRSLEILIEEDEHEVEHLLQEHPDLFRELIQLANAVYSSGLIQPIRTIVQTGAMLGYTKLRQWILVVLLARQSMGEKQALIQLLVGRACFIEDLAKDIDLDTDDAYLVGLLSLADCLLGLPIAAIVAQLNLHEGLEEALLFRGGPLGELLALCEFMEGYRDINDAQGDPGLACSFAAFGQHRLMEAKSKAMFMASRLRFQQALNPKKQAKRVLKTEN